ncbi:MAG: hypothetical protein R3D51_17815 [Hyphomicrobiaceae bacterium]
MNKEQFANLFLRELEQAAKTACEQFKLSLPDNFRIELHGAGGEGRIYGLSEAIDKLFLGDSRFFKIIDIAVKAIGNTETIFFVRVSGHVPCAWSETWDPVHSGPFKQLRAIRVGSETK